MAAASAAIVPHVSAGDHVVASRTYGDTRNLLERVLARFGVAVTFAADTTAESYRDAMQPETRLVVLETPANPTLDCVDIASVCRKIATETGARVVVDNTFASPYNTRPIALGAHAVFHSATKYLAGHSDVVAGVVAGDDIAVARAWEHLRTEGGVLSPFDAWLVVRGIRTFPCEWCGTTKNGLGVARFLKAHADVARACSIPCSNRTRRTRSPRARCAAAAAS